MRTRRQRWLAAATAIGGAGALALGMASMPAVGTETASEEVEPEASDATETPAPDEPERRGEPASSRSSSEAEGPADTAADDEPDDPADNEAGDGADETATDGELALAAELPAGLRDVDELDEDELAAVAQDAGMTVNELSAALEDESAVITPSGFVAVTPRWELTGLELGDLAVLPNPSPDPSASAVGDLPGDPESGSRPGAAHTVFLDFDGYTVENAELNRTYGVDVIEISSSTASPADRREIWERVAQDFAPFDVNVTTSAPDPDALHKTSADDESYGAHVVIAPDHTELPEELHSAGGVAFRGMFGAAYTSPSLVVADNLIDEPEFIAKAISHQLGVELGLGRHGIGDDEYYYGSTPADEDALWGPTMGMPFDVPLATWSNGQYADATNPEQDDLATMTATDVADTHLVLFDEDGQLWTGPYCTSGDPEQPRPGDEFFQPNDDVDPDGDPDDLDPQLCDPPGPALTARWDHSDRLTPAADPHADTREEATSLENDTGEFDADGVIVDGEDRDVFAFATNGGSVRVSATPVGVGPDLDIKLSLLDADGTVIAEGEQESAVVPGTSRASGLEASVEADVEIGRYFVVVEGRGQGDPADNTPSNGCCYPEYGSLGFYELSGEAEPFDAEPVVITEPEDGDEVEPSNLQVAGTAEPGGTVTVSRDDERVTDVDVDEDGSWRIIVTDDLPYGTSTITAAQVVGGIEVPETASVTVSVPLDPPEITKPVDGDRATSRTPTFTGTGVDGAEITATIECGDMSVSETAQVDGDGAWSFVPGTELPDGDCEIVAVQEVGGVSSEPTEPVGFVVDVEDGSGDDSGDGGDEGTDDGSGGGSDDTDDGSDGNDDGGNDLPDTGGGSTGMLLIGAVLLLLGGLLFARSRQSHPLLSE